jgi:hypothetical protein
MRLTSLKGVVHHVTIPAHDSLRIGTLSQILSEVASYLERSRDKLIQALFFVKCRSAGLKHHQGPCAKISQREELGVTP